MQIIILHDEQNTFSNKHSGFSLFVKHKRVRILFDFSHKKDIFKNAKKINLDINKDIDFFVVSHSHIDHIANLEHLNLQKRKPLILHPQALLPKFFKGENIGITKPILDSLSQFKVLPSKEPFFINKDIVFMGEIKRGNSKHFGENFFGDDYILDDSALLINTNKYPVLVTGCSHSGIINIIKQADQIFDREVKVVIGGLHIFEDGNDEIFEFLKERGIKIIFGHCYDEKNGKKLEEMNAVKMKTLDCFEF
ncbi:MBL fold metallo-hydrolase [Candidatus Gracilibacteria bacterium]|nr:MBL fold metallo-hydrolase [Candidatus Gracilibacteria bacterium]